MKRSLNLLATAVLGLLLVLMACDGNGVGPDVPVSTLSSLQTSYNDRDNRFYVAVTVTPPVGAGELDSVWTEMYLLAEDGAADTSGADTALITVTLVDDATGGDILPEDGVYARKFISPLPQEESGPVRFVFHAEFGQRTYSAHDTLYLENVPPWIVAVTVSDTLVTRPLSALAGVVDSLYVEADDANGVDDLKTVIFQIVKPDGSLGVGLDGVTDFPLYDDGTRIDVEEGDGIFSGGITFRLANPVGTYTLRFVAKDRANASSDTVDQAIVLQ